MANRVEKLNNKGIIAWEVDGVLGRLTKAQSKDANFVLEMKPLVEMGVILATHMRDRATKGSLADAQPVPPSDKRGWHKEGQNWVSGQVVSEEYAAAAGLSSTTYASAADMKAAIKGELQQIGFVTGGMWAGIQARGSGKSGVIIDFGGSSPGHGGFATFAVGAPVVSDGGKPIPLMVRTPETVRNQQKAWVVFSKHQCSPIEPLADENTALCEAATALAQKSVLKQFGDSEDDWRHGVNLDFGGDSSLREKLLTGWVK